MGVGASSSSSKKYEVFLSFRGEDTRRSFTSHLHTALLLKGIETFIDYDLPKGNDISQSLIQAIQDSSLSVIVFSENYASSKWCLNELIEILRCKEKGQLVVPIFYQVDPSHVRHQRGAYEEAFAQHLKKNPDKVAEWRKALFETASLAGWNSCTYRDEAELIQEIVSDIVKKLNHGSSSAPANIVGIDKNCDDIELLLEGFSRIGIWGMGGIGKTTMAKVVFAKFRSQFDSSYFLENFREEEEKHGRKYICDKLVNELSNDGSLKGLSRRKVLIVLDDVSDTSHLDYLENEVAPFIRLGSKVIITSRERHVLEGRVERIHEAIALGHDNSLKLFNLEAFRKDNNNSEYKELVERAVAYAGGVPLALTVLGSYLHSKTIKEWESALSKLERMTHQNIQNVLKLSYDRLDDEEKEVFLDIACFFKGESEGYVLAMLESFGFHGHISLRNLADKALISVVHDTICMQNHVTVRMHDLIQAMAFEIVRQECRTNPERRSRLWNPDEIYDVLKYNRGSDTIQGISLNMSQIRDLQLSTDTFKKMTKLRFLKFYSSWGQRSCTVNLPYGFDSFSESLRYLQWDNFPSESLPLSFCAEKIVGLHMPKSHLKKLWDGVQNLVNLREISLEGSKYLTELPDISTAQNLERLDLESCESLSHIDPSILCLPRLHKVSVRDCRSLKSLKSERHSESVAILDFLGCSSLKEFSFSSSKIGVLYLATSPIEILDFPIGHMEKLQDFDLTCSKLKNLPIDDMTCCMRSLTQLRLFDCGGMIDKSKLHTLFDSLLSLRSIHLIGACELTELPQNIKHLSKLSWLIVSNCKSLQSLPELPPSIRDLNARDCTSLKTLQLTSHIEASSVSYLRRLSELILCGCEQLYELPESIGSLFSLHILDLRGSNIESLPVSIKHLLHLSTIKLSNCKRLRSLPELPLFIYRVDADGCISLEIVRTLATAPRLTSLFLKDCLKLENSYMESACFPLKEAIYGGSWRREFCYPGRKVPEWFKSNQGIVASNNISIERPSTTTDLIGFVLCSVLSHLVHGDHLQCQLYYDGKKYTCSEFEGRWKDNEFYGVKTNFDSHHVFLWCVSDMFINFGKTMDGQNPNYRPNVSFEFSVVTGSKTDSGKTDSETDGETDGEIDGEADSEIDSEKFVDGVIEACGVCPIYASEYPKFIQQMELEANSAAQKETCQDDYENLFHGILKYANFSLKTGKYGNLQGSNIPEWFTYKSSMESSISYVTSSLYVRVQVAPDLDKLMGFIFGFVIPNFSTKERDQCYSTFMGRLDYERTGGPEFFGPNGWHYSMIKSSSDNVFLWYDPFLSECILKRLKNLRGRIGCDTKIDLTFFFDLGYGMIDDKTGEIDEETGEIDDEKREIRIDNCLIKEFGVRPIYISEYTNFLQQEKMKEVKDSSINQPIPKNSESGTSDDVDESLLLLALRNF
ncbi:hypothetical protein QN277_022374 [Acacia crassicarpa]|uniref:ADP-ribosyl cyclase/cyclic ADP-ribose hydrolase n=1 Tax=Acacia crassicarpa TaxID=499986 RepID=A0AAE1MPJ5_9FABA|nr:hypothetical protein QN277_022374 [Acacia crassicarpa]